jgi:hypothetical protein
MMGVWIVYTVFALLGVGVIILGIKKELHWRRFERGTD